MLVALQLSELKDILLGYIFQIISRNNNTIKSQHLSNDHCVPDSGLSNVILSKYYYLPC